MRIKTLTCALGLALGLASSAAAQDGWRTLDPENVLVIDTNKGRIIAELTNVSNPEGAERIRVLARAHFYDGLKFFRVIDTFMDQTGDPENTGEGGSDLADLKGQFSFRRGAETPFAPAPSDDGNTGFIGVLPVLSQPDDQMLFTADHKTDAHVLFCPGVIGLARAREPDTANSQFFLMRGPYPSLNGKYAAVGRVVSGLDVVRAIKTGEPVAEPMDAMTRVRLASDLPEGERPTVRVMDTASPAFTAQIAQARAAAGNDFDICTVDIPASVQ